MMLVLLFVIGTLVGSGLTLFVMRAKNIGMLRLDTSDYEPYLFLELSKGIEEIYKHKYVTLRVCVKNLLSQK